LKYRIYIDETGNPDLESSDNPNHRYLSLTGVIVSLDHVQNIIHPQMEELKGSYFGQHPDEPVILHREEIINRRPPFQALNDGEVRLRFDDALLRLLETWEYSVITVCIDKKRHKEQYNAWRYDPYHYCLAVLLERYVFFLNERQQTGDVMAESRGGKEDRRLKDSYARLWDKGTDYVEPELFHKVLTSRQLKVKLKINKIAGLQLADLLANPSRNEILEEKGLLERSLGAFAIRVIQILQRKYYQKDGVLFGKKFI
jgi:hypothetical protein